MVLPLWQRLRQYSRGSLKTSSWVTVHAIQAMGIASKNNHATCVLNSMVIECKRAGKCFIEIRDLAVLHKSSSHYVIALNV